MFKIVFSSTTDVCSMLFVTSSFVLVKNSGASVASVDAIFVIVFGWETVSFSNVDITEIVLLVTVWNVAFWSIFGVGCIFESTSFDVVDDEDFVGKITETEI